MTSPMADNDTETMKTPAEPDPRAVLDRLSRAMPEPRCELDHADAWQLLVATILSAQSTDRTVNRVTPDLFDLWPAPTDLAAAPLEDIERVVRPTGFFRRKAKAIRSAAERVRDDFEGQVPRDLDALVTLPGVARKTANLVLGTAYRVPSGIVVDTHAGRVARRLGLTTETKPDRVEADLCRAWPQETWIDMSHRLILHGRYVCTARTPACDHCPINEICPDRKAEPVGIWTDRAERERRLVESRGEDAGAG